MTTFPPEYPHFEIQHSKSSIADFAEPRLMSIGGFAKMTGATLEEVTSIAIETHDGRQWVELDSYNAKYLMQRGNKAPRPG
jgi:hypothetical protein